MAKQTSPPLAEALRQAGQRPDTVGPPPRFSDNRGAKKNWAQRFSQSLASTIARALDDRYPKARITPYPDGTGQEYTVGGKVDRKRTDVGIWDDAAGLIAGVSIKTQTFRDTDVIRQAGKVVGRKVGRYSKNSKRMDMELRDEADTLHRRQPYAVLVAILFMNEDACWDGITGHSSFAYAVFTLRKRTGRADPEARFDLFEEVYIGLFDADGNVRFFDVRTPPPENQPPGEADTLSFEELIERIDDAVDFRNTGVRKDEKYAPKDPSWSPPAGSLPEGLDEERVLTLDDVIESAGEDPDVDQED